MTPFQIYLITRLDNINCALGSIWIVAAILSIIMFIATAIVFSDGNDEDCRVFKKWLFRCMGIFLITMGINIFVPTTKDIIAMYTVPAVLNNAEAKKLPTNVLKFVNEWLETNSPKKQEEK